MKSISKIFAILIIPFFFSCEEEELVASVNEVINEKNAYIVGDSILLKGNNLHKVTSVNLVINGAATTRSVEFRNKDVRPEGYDFNQNELMVFIPNDATLFGKNIKFELAIYEDFETGLGRRDETLQEFKILTPEVKSISSLDLILSESPAIVEINNYYLEKYNNSFEVIANYYYSGSLTWTYIDYEILDDKTLLIRRANSSGAPKDDLDIEIQFNRRSSSVSTGHESDYDLLLGKFSTYFNYNIPNEHPYSPGSAIFLQSDNFGGGAYRNMESFKVGVYNTRFGWRWGGVLYTMPTDMIFTSGEKMEVVFPKENHFLNIDNSHNYVEIVDALYRVTDFNNSEVDFEINTWYSSQFLNVEVVDQDGVITRLDQRDYEKEDSTKVNYQYKLEIGSLKPGSYTLHLFSRDDKYALKPAGLISFSKE